MPLVKALSGFEHNGTRRRGSKFNLSDNEAKQLVKKGLVRYVNITPMIAAGGKSSALPVAQVSQKQTAKKSKSGARKKKSAASSSRTQRSE